MKYILALDQGTTSSRAILFDRAGDRSDRALETSAMIPGGPSGRLLVGGAGMFVTLFAMIEACVHPAGESEVWWVTKVVGGAGVFFLIGGYFYWRGARRT